MSSIEVWIFMYICMEMYVFVCMDGYVCLYDNSESMNVYMYVCVDEG